MLNRRAYIPILPLTLGRRIGFGAAVFLGTIAWVSSFAGSFEIAFAYIIGAAAAIAWLGLGIVIALVKPGPISITAWMDVCLQTQCAGTCILLADAMLNLTHTYFRGWDYSSALLLADLVMTAIFFYQAASLHVKLKTALALWIVALHGCLATTIFAFLYFG